MEDELTEEMHGELSISPEDELKFRVFTVLEAIEAGIFERSEAIEVYNVTEEQIQQHEAEYRRLNE